MGRAGLSHCGIQPQFAAQDGAALGRIPTTTSNFSVVSEWYANCTSARRRIGEKPKASMFTKQVQLGIGVIGSAGRAAAQGAAPIGVRSDRLLPQKTAIGQPARSGHGLVLA
jgi:hypothetical protein